MRTVVALALVAGTAGSALADPPALPAQPNPYAACMAEAGPIFGSVLTIEQLRQYMAEHPSCAGAAVPARPLAKTPEEKRTDCINMLLTIERMSDRGPSGFFLDLSPYERACSLTGT